MVLAEPFSPSLSSSSTTSSSSSSSFPSPAVYDAANDSFLDTAQIFVCLPAGSPQLLRAVLLTRAGGATRFSSYRPSVTHIVTSSLSFLASSLRSDRYSLLPASLLATSSSPSALCSSLPCPVLSIDWLERCVASHQLLPSAGFELQEELAAAAAASSRLSSVARQGVAEDFAAFNASISKSRLGRGAAGKEARKERRRSRSTAGGSGIFSSRLFLLAGLHFDVEQELLLSLRRAGGDVIAEDEEETADVIVTPVWDATLAARHPRAEVVSPAFVHDCLAASVLLSPAASITFSPLPDPVVAIPAFSAFIMSCTGFQAEEKQLLALLIPALGAQLTAGLNGSNTHLIVKDGCAEGDKWDRVWEKMKGGRSWSDRVKSVSYTWLLRCAREGRHLQEDVWLLKKEDGEKEKAKAREKPALPEEEQRRGRQHAEPAGRAASLQTQAVTVAAAPAEEEEETQQQQMMEDEDAQPAATEERPATPAAAQLSAIHSSKAEKKHEAVPRKRAGRRRARVSEEADEDEEQVEESKHEKAAKPAVRKKAGRSANDVQQLNGGLAETTDAESTRKQEKRAAAAAERKEESGAEEVKEQAVQSAARVGERKAERVREEAKEQRDDEQMLLPAETSSPADPFSLPRYGRQHGTVTRVNRIFTPPKAPAAGSRTSAAAESGRAEQLQPVKRRLPMLEEGRDDPFGFPEERAEEEKKGGVEEEEEQDGKAEKKEAEATGKGREKQEKDRDAAKGKAAAAAAEQKTAAEADDARARRPATMPAADRLRPAVPAKGKPVAAVAAKPHTESKTDAPMEVEDGVEAEEAEQEAEAKDQREQEQGLSAKAEAKLARGDKRAPVASAKRLFKRAAKDDTEAEEEKAQAAKSPATELKQEETVTGSHSGQKPARAAKAVDAVAKTSATKRGRKSTAETESEAVRPAAAAAAAALAPVAPAAAPADQLRSARAQRKQALREREKEREEETPLKPKQRPAAKRKAAADSDDEEDTGDDESGRSAGKKLKSDADGSASSSSMQNLFCFALSGFGRGERGVDKYSAMIRSLQGAVLPDVCVDYSLCSALITYGEQPLKRTEKTLVAVVAGLPIVSRRYVEDSARHGYWQSVGRYRLKSGAPGVEAGSMGDALLRAGERWRVRRPFRDWSVHLHLTDPNVDRMLRNVLSMGGAGGGGGGRRGHHARLRRRRGGREEGGAAAAAALAVEPRCGRLPQRLRAGVRLLQQPQDLGRRGLPAHLGQLEQEVGQPLARGARRRFQLAVHSRRRRARQGQGQGQGGGQQGRQEEEELRPAADVLKC